MTNEVRFKGNVFTYRRIIDWVSIFTISIIVILLFFYYKGYDILFQLIDILGSNILFMSILFFSALLAMTITHFIFSNIYGKEVNIRLLENDTLEIKNGYLNQVLSIKNIQSISYSVVNNKLTRISIKTDKKLYINAGSIFQGVTDKDVVSFFQQYYRILEAKNKFKTVRNYSTVKNKTTEIHTSSIKDNSQPQKKKIIYIALGIITYIIVLFLAIYIVMRINSDDDPDNMVSNTGVNYNNSNYYLYNNEVYFHRESDGYYKVKEADPSTFKPLNKKGQYSSNMGIDKYAVYAGTEKVEELDPNRFEYIGAYYTKNAENVYYKNHKIKNIDPHSFHLLTQDNHNSAKLPYGYDKDHIVYKDKILENVNVPTFRFEQISYNISYATDGKKHFINGREFPNKVKNKIIGSTDIDFESLKLLQRNSEFSYHTLFADKNSIYYWDETKQGLYCISHSIPNIKAIKDGVYTDGKQMYYSKKKRIKGRRSGTTAYITLIVTEDNKTVAKAKSGTKVIYESDQY